MENFGLIFEKKKPNSKKDLLNILNPIVKKWFFSKFSEFSLPQLFSVLEIHSRKNILISAPTGATKTLTAFLAIINELVDSSIKGILENKVYCVYVSPLKALNNDIQKNLVEPLDEIEKVYGKKLNIRVGVRTGDTSVKEKADMLKNPPHILITTPESLGIILSSIKFREHLIGVDWFIADEIHALADNKRGVHLSLSMERLAYLSSHITRIGLSATIAPIHEIANFLVGVNNSCIMVNVDFIKKMDLKVISPMPDLINVSSEEIHEKLYSKLHKLIQKHKTTLIFTNTRSGTERVVDFLKEKFPKFYQENIGAHHGSLSKEHRTLLENNLKLGKMKVVVCSTSLELGIDIGFIDLVISIGSPKSVARALQRIGRSGHKLDSITKGRIIVFDRDDLIECAILLKSAIERKIDKIQIPKNALDVLAQQIFGMAIDQVWNERELFNLIKKSYCYKDLLLSDFNDLLDYLSGEYVSLEDRYVYAKIWRKDGFIGKRGKMARVIYMTNIGTIPDQSGVSVKLGSQIVGIIDEAFLERLRPGDVFILGGNRYLFKYSRGMSAFVSTTVDRPPTVPSWISEMLPLSFDLAIEIGKFRRNIEEKFILNKSKNEILDFIKKYLYLDNNSANAIYLYFYEQFNYVNHIPNDKKILIENYMDFNQNRKIIFHCLFGRRVNDVLSRVIAYSITKLEKRDLEIAINDNGFYIGINKSININKVLSIINPDNLRKIMDNAIDNSEILKRRFRHCASRSLMILKNYKGNKKTVSKQQINSSILINSVKRISNDFSILKEARREVLEDQMDIKNAYFILKSIFENKITIKEIETKIPSPFSFNIVLLGIMEIVKIEDKMDFLKKMHNLVIAKISLDKNKSTDDKKEFISTMDDFDYYKNWRDEELKEIDDKLLIIENFKIEISKLDFIPLYVKDELINFIDGKKNLRTDVLKLFFLKEKEFEKQMSKELFSYLLNKMEKL
ncbi:MAG: ATP-dependent helicase [Nanoarchaeota archaeon]